MRPRADAAADATGGAADIEVAAGASAERVAMHCSGMPGAMRERLQRATRRQHERLDAASLLTPLMLPQVPLAAYQAAMVAMLRAYRPVDACLLQMPPPDHGMQVAVLAKTLAPYQPRSPALQRDLDAMGIAPDAFVPATSAGLDMPTTLPAYLGMRYVVEGAQFGNRVIGRNLQAAFGAGAQDICSAWMTGAEANAVWPGLMAALAALDSRRDVAAALRGARRMFGYFVARLCVLPEQRPVP